LPELKPAWYSSKQAGIFSDIRNLLHPPYTLWHLSYVLMGIAVSPVIYYDRSIAVLIAFFLGLGIGAHALDETMGNPLQTRLSKKKLYLIGFGSLAAAVGIGLYYVVTLSILILPFVVAESFFAIAYNLEMFGKRFHSTVVFMLSWGAIPFLIGFFVNSLTLTPAVLLLGTAMAILTYVQKTLSTEARKWRRKIVEVKSIRVASGEEIPFGNEMLISSSEKSLKALTVMIFIFAIALLLLRI
jgi:hypothetical protein